MVQKNDGSLFLPLSAESTRAAELARTFGRGADAAGARGAAARGRWPGRRGRSWAAAQQFAAGVARLPVTGGSGDWGAHLSGDPVAVRRRDPTAGAVLVAVPLDAAAADQLIGGERTAGLLVTDLRAALTDRLGAGPRSCR